MGMQKRCDQGWLPEPLVCVVPLLKGPTLGLTLCCRQLEIFKNSGTGGSTFSFKLQITYSSWMRLTHVTLHTRRNDFGTEFSEMK